jgi:hypothetical protein
MKKSLVVANLFGVLLLLYSPWILADSFQEMVHKAVQLQNEARWQEAAVWTEEIIRQHPDHERLPEAYSWLVHYWAKAEDYPKSKVACFTILEKFSTNPHYVGFANRSLAVHFFREKNQQEGQKYAKAYIEAFPDTAEAQAIAISYGFKKSEQPAAPDPKLTPVNDSEAFTRTTFKPSLKDLLHMKITKENFMHFLPWIGGLFLFFVVGIAFLIYYIGKDEVTLEEY